MDVQSLLLWNKNVRLSVQSRAPVVSDDTLLVESVADNLNISTRSLELLDSGRGRSAVYDLTLDDSAGQEQVFQSQFDELPPIVPAPAAVTTETISDDLERLSRSYGQDMNAWLDDSLR